MSTRERHAHVLRIDAYDEVHRLRMRAWNAGANGDVDNAAEEEAAAALLARIDTLQWFAGLADADAELEFDGAPDTQEQVTTPAEVCAR